MKNELDVNFSATSGQFTTYLVKIVLLTSGLFAPDLQYYVPNVLVALLRRFRGMLRGGGGRYVEGCRAFPYSKITDALGSLVLGFMVFWFYGFKSGRTCKMARETTNNGLIK